MAQAIESQRVRAPDYVGAGHVFVISFDDQRLIEADLLEHVLESEGLLPGRVLASVVDDIRLQHFPVVQKLRVRVLLSKGVLVFEKLALMDRDGQVAVSIQIWAWLGIRRHDYELGLNDQLADFLVLVE